MIYFLTAILVLGVAAVVVMALVNSSKNRLDGNRKARVESERALGKAERALRSIANGAGNPVLEAQIALDEINLYHEKELN